MRDDLHIASRFAIVGIGCRFPGDADSPDLFWKLLCDGRDAITDIPEDRPDWHRLYDPDPLAPGRIYARRGGFVRGIDQFDGRFFGISPREATRIDPQQRMLLEVAWHALEDARISQESIAGTDTGVFVGVSTHDYADVQMYPANRDSIDAHSNTGGATAIAANRISYVFDLRGPSLVVDTACSSALTAVHLACRALAAGDCSIAIAGGAQLLLRPELTIGFCRATMLSVDGRCAAFDAAGNGYVRSEGAGAIVLKPLERALADGDPIYAVILGSAVNQDGHSAGLTVPSENSQKGMLQTALRRADRSPSSVQYVEAHGTGTAVGDPIEARAIGTVFREGRCDAEPLRLGSVKTNIGHLEAASGIAGLIKTALAIRHRQLPPSLHFNTWNTAIDPAALKLQMVTKLEPWPQTPDGPAAAVNSFGFGGANACVVLGAPPAKPAEGPCASHSQSELLTLSARSQDSLKVLARSVADSIAADNASLPAICGAAALGRSHHDHRLAIVGGTTSAMIDGLDSFLAGDRVTGVASGRVSPGAGGKLAFIFSGMGPQWWGMGRQLLEQNAIFRSMMERCDAALKPHAGFSLIAAFQAEEAASRLAHPEFAQVSNFALQVSLNEVWQAWGVQPASVLGHSGGAMAAAYVAGAHDLEQAIWLCYHRSRLQGRASNAGAMLAVGLPETEAAKLIAGHEGAVSIAAINGPKSVTLAGSVDVLNDIAARLADRQVFARILPVTIAYHSPKMDPIRTEFLDAVGGLTARDAKLPLVSDTTGTWAQGAELSADYWWRAIRQPVRFADGMATLIAAGHDTYVEISPHPVLAGSMGECLGAQGTKGLVVPTLRRNEDDRATMLRSLGTLYAHGANPNWRALYRRETDVGLPLYPFQRERHWFEASESAMVDGGGDAPGAADASPLLGRRLHNANPSWEARMAARELDFLDDHVIQGAAVFPGAGYVAMSLSIARRLSPKGEVAVRDVEFLRPLVLSDRAPMHVQAIVDTEHTGIEISATSAPDRSTWETYARARLGEATGLVAANLDLAALRTRLAAGEPEGFYQSLQRRGLNYGPRFRGVTALHIGKGEALAQIGPVAGVAGDPDGLNPALLDSAFQLLAAVTASARPDDSGLFLPTHIDEVVLHRAAGTNCWAYCRLESLSSQRVSGAISIVDDQGAPLMTVRGLQARSVEMAGAGEDAVDSLLYDYRWEPKVVEVCDLPPRRQTLLSSGDAAQITCPPDSISRFEAETEWPRYYTEAEAMLSEVASTHVMSAFAALGLPTRINALIPAAEIDALKDKEPSGGRWLTRLVDLLIETGSLEVSPGGWRVCRVPSKSVPAELAERYRIDLALLAEAGKTLPSALRGEGSGKDAIFTTETLPILKDFYHVAPASAFYNRILADVIARISSQAGRDGCLRVLEVGAGTGGATGVVLEQLPREQVKYLLTDTAPLLLDAAKQRFEGRPGLETRIFDLSSDFEVQGFARGSFDLIVAANVVHATPDVAEALERLRDLLLPGGALVMMEITRHPRWLDVIFGQTRGWWSFADRDLRMEHPLLESRQWLEQFQAAGFEHVWHSQEPTASGEAAQSVIVAQSAKDGSVSGSWLILVDENGSSNPIVDGLRALGHRVITSSGKELPALLDELPTDLSGIVSMRSLSAADDFSAAQQCGVHAELDLLQSILTRQALSACPVWIVTSGATRVPGDVDDNVLLSPIWGLGRTVLKEHPDLPMRLVDLKRGFGPVEVSALLRELTEHDADEEVALRDNVRFVRRLRRVTRQDIALRQDVSASLQKQWRAEIGKRGVIGSLRTREFASRVPGAGELQIGIRAASLNFRDVMLATGGIPGLEDEMSFGHQHLGSDCAGIVTAVGPGVTSFAPGDSVMGMAPGSLGSMSTTNAELVVRMPERLSFEAAASIPTVFLTAWYALMHVARLQRGERILIHAATGGVGLAAIQIARNVGAEILATAGSDAKREHLRALGITHVMNSRTLAFADDVRSALGGRGVDVVLNSLAGEAIARGISCLEPYGRFLEIGKLDIYTNRNLALGRFRQNLTYAAIDLDRLCAERPAVIGEMLGELSAEFAAGRLQPTQRHEFDSAKLEDAFRMMAQAKHIGKIVVSNSGTRPTADVVRGLDQVLRPDASYLVTGGLGGFGLEVAEFLAKGGAGGLALMGRRPPGAHAAQRIEVLRAGGVKVEVVLGDVSRELDIERAFQRIDAVLPPLRGVFHGAMQLDDRRFVDMDAASLDTVLAPKARGAWNLHRLTAGRELDHFVMFSSISSLLGNPLQANYGAACTFLDELAKHRHANGLPALSINWGVLAGAGYVADRPDLQRFLEQQGYKAFSLKQALGALGVLLDRDASQTMVADIDWRKLATAAPHAAASPRLVDLIPVEDHASSSAAVSEIMATLGGTDAAERPAALAAFLSKALGRVLGIPPADLDMERPFNELGLDSLLAVEFMMVLTRDLGVQLPVIALLDGMTIRKLAAIILPKLDVAATKSATKGRPSKSSTPASKPDSAVSEVDRPVVRSASLPVVDAEQTLSARPAGPAIVTAPSQSRYAGLDYGRWSPLQTVARSISRAGFASIARLDVAGLENLPARGPVILAVNHLSMADVPLALTIIPRRTIIMATEKLKRSQVLDWLVGHVGQAIYVPKYTDTSAALESAVEVLACGGVLALAPEGTRSKTGLKRAQTGVAWLAQKTGVPVVPYVAWGQENWRDRLSHFRRLDVTVRIGSPIAPPPPASGDMVLRSHADKIMLAMAELLPPNYRGVYAASMPSEAPRTQKVS